MRYTVILLSILVLSSCSGETKSAVGITRQAPDEYSVISRPPLSLPPDFNLRPTKEADGMKARQRTSDFFADREKSKEIKSKDLSLADVNLLQRSGSNERDPNIRTLIAKEHEALEHRIEEDSLSKFYYFYKQKKENPVIDPHLEKENLAKKKN